MIASAIPTLVLIGLAAVLAPLTDEALRRFVAVPEVVILILFGVMLRPSVRVGAHEHHRHCAAAGMLSVLIYPLIALRWLGQPSAAPERRGLVERAAEEEQ
jgi:hypothetical protein